MRKDKDEERRKAAELRHLMTSKLHEGWDNVRQFTMGSKIPYSIETTRRAFVSSEHKNLAPYTLAIICRYLGFNAEEIVHILREYTDDNDLWRLIDTSAPKLTPVQEALLAAYEELTREHPGMSCRLADQIELLASACGADVSEHTAWLRDKKRE